MILDSIHSPEDIRALDQNQLPQLCKELRQFLLENVSKTGGHFSSNLGVVELTVALPQRIGCCTLRKMTKPQLLGLLRAGL